MLLPARETPLMCAFNMVLRVMHDAVRWSIMRSDRRQTPSLSPGLRAQTIVAWQRMSAMIDEFNRLLHLAQRGRLRGHVRAAEGDAAAAGETDARAGDANAEGTQSGDAKSGDAKAGVETGAERKARVMRVLTHPFGDYAVTGPGQLPPLTYQQMHGFGWMRSFAGADAARARLVELLDDPVTVEVIRGSKSMTRIVRRLCHGLEVTAPAGVLAMLPRRNRGKNRNRSTRFGVRTSCRITSR